MVQVQCAWVPLVDRNPQVFCDIPHAKPGDFRKAEQRVYHSTAQPSRIDVLELK
jgi:predicted acyl esterase